MWRRPRLVLLLAWIVFGGLSCGFGYTDGLAYSDSGIPSIAHVSDLQSSGSDDDMCIEMGAVFAVAMVLWTAVRVKRPFGAADIAMNVALIAAQMVYLLAIEAGSIWQTIVLDRNWVLVGWLVTLAALVALVPAAVICTRSSQGVDTNAGA